jgi:hypothetical protein
MTDDDRLTALLGRWEDAEDRDGTTMTAHGVVFGDGWWWFDSYGFTPTAPGTAEWRGGTLILTRRRDRGRTMTAIRCAHGRLEQHVDAAVPADARSSRCCAAATRAPGEQALPPATNHTIAKCCENSV